MLISIHHESPDSNTYRAARIKSLFNVSKGNTFDFVADLPIETFDWKLGVVVGPSGSGKTSIGRVIFSDEGEPVFRSAEWPQDKILVDAFPPGIDISAIEGSLASVGLGDINTWVRPYHVLSNGERFRADLARLVAEAPARAVVDEFTSVVDRQIAKFGALAFAKAWKRTSGQCVLLTPHYDVLEWLEPDWVFDTGTKTFDRRRLHRPRFDLQIWETDWRYWPKFEPHHYLVMPKMVAAQCFVGTVDGELVCHLAVAPRLDVQQFRAARLVVMPEWQGAGVGMRFLNAICQRHLEGKNRYSAPYQTCFHTSHPGLVASLLRDPKWKYISGNLYARHKRGPARLGGKKVTAGVSEGIGFGGHFRAVQGFRYVGATS